jgi:hypothetical protein
MIQEKKVYKAKEHCRHCGKEIDLESKEYYFGDTFGFFCVECFEQAKKPI